MPIGPWRKEGLAHATRLMGNTVTAPVAGSIPHLSPGPDVNVLRMGIRSIDARRVHPSSVRKFSRHLD